MNAQEREVVRETEEDEVEGRILLSEEAAFVLWFQVLPTWDKRTVLKNEMEWHDRFVQGEWSHADLRAAIEAARGESPDSDTT